MDKTMERLYEAAAEKEVAGQSALARALGQTPQVVKNWEARGISKNGMLLAQKKLGVSAIWLETGQGEMYPITTAPPNPAQLRPAHPTNCTTSTARCYGAATPRCPKMIMYSRRF